MLFWIRSNQKPILGILLLIVILQLISWDLKEGGFWAMPSRILVTLTSLPVRAVRGAVLWVEGAGDWVRRTDTLIKENEDLRKEVTALRADKLEGEEIQKENARLRDLLNFRERMGFPTLPARVIGEDPGNNFRTILIDKGTRQNVGKGMAVVTADGVVGQIVRVAPTASQVLLMMDPNSSVDVLIERSRAKGILTGWKVETCQIKFLGRTEDVKPGDRVITSGLGGVFPKGVDVGVVKDVERKSWGVFQKAYVSPAVDFGKLEEVLIVLE